jgi:hypothetical protein
MRKSGKKKEYPHVDTWNYIPRKEFQTNSSYLQVPTDLSRIEGYCMLNVEYSMSKDRYDYELKSNGDFKRKRNERFDPTKNPEPYPEGCPRSIRSKCTGCQHFAWCDPDDDMTLVKKSDNSHKAI